MYFELVCFLKDIMNALIYVFMGGAFVSLVITTIQMVWAECKYDKVLKENGFKGDIDEIYNDYFKEKK